MGLYNRSLIAAALVLGLYGGAVWAEEEKGTTGAAGAAATAPVNINTADQKALEKLPGIGEAKAKAIIAYREKNGPFKSVDDLAKVEGIGDKTVGALKGLVVVE